MSDLRRRAWTAEARCVLLEEALRRIVEVCECATGAGLFFYERVVRQCVVVAREALLGTREEDLGGDETSPVAEVSD